MIKLKYILFISLTFSTDSLNTNSSLPLGVAVVPGMGQIYNKQYLKAGTLVSLEAYAIYKTLEFQDLDQFSKRNTYVWWLGGLYLLGVIDAYVESHLKSFPKEQKEDKDN